MCHCMSMTDYIRLKYWGLHRALRTACDLSWIHKYPTPCFDWVLSHKYHLFWSEIEKGDDVETRISSKQKAVEITVRTDDLFTPAALMPSKREEQAAWSGHVWWLLEVRQVKWYLIKISRWPTHSLSVFHTCTHTDTHRHISTDTQTDPPSMVSWE